jgi:hypothetical protein
VAFVCCVLYQAYDAFFQASGLSGGSDWYVAVQGRTPVSMAIGSSVSNAALRRTESFLILLSLADAAPPPAAASCPAWPGQISLTTPTGTEQAILIRTGLSGGVVSSRSPMGLEAPSLNSNTTCRRAGSVSGACAARYTEMAGSPAVAESAIAFGSNAVFRWIRPSSVQGSAAPPSAANITLWQIAGGGGGLRLTVRRGSLAYAPGPSAAADTADVSGRPGDGTVRATTIAIRLGGSAAGGAAALWIWVEGISPLLPSIPFRLVVDAGPTGFCALALFPPPSAGNLAMSTVSNAALGIGGQMNGLIGPVPTGWLLVVRAEPAVDAAAGICRFGSVPPGTRVSCAYSPPPEWNGLESILTSRSEVCGKCFTLQGWQFTGLATRAPAASPMAVVRQVVSDVLYPVRSP